MIISQSLFFFLFCLVVYVSAGDGNVHALDASTLDEFVSKHDFSMLEFYAPWCPHCQRLEPEYEKLASALADVNVGVGKIDCDADDNKKQCTRFNALGFPTLIFVRGSSIDDESARLKYQGARTATALESYVRKQLRPAMTVVKSVEQETELAAKERVLLVAHFRRTEAATSGRGRFGVVEDACRKLVGDIPCVARFEAGDSTIRLLKHYDEAELTYDESDGSVRADELVVWAKRNSIPRFVKHSKDVHGFDYPLLFVHIEPSDAAPDASGAGAEAVRAVAEVARRLGNEPLTFAWLDRYEWDGKRAGLSGNTYPAIHIDNIKALNHRYVYDESWPIDVEHVERWARQFLNGELERTLVSEPLELCADNDASDVKTVVLHNFDELVANRDDGRDVFVMFHSPTCGTCRQTYPAFEELARRLRDSVTSLVFAKSNAWMNDLPNELKLAGVPDFRLFKHGEAVAAAEEFFSSQRTAENMAKWLVKRVSSEADRRALAAAFNLDLTEASEDASANRDEL